VCASLARVKRSNAGYEVCRQAGPLVADVQLGRSVIGMGLDLYGSVAVSEGVVDEVADRPL
jgi:hypothetical protein